MKGRKGIPPWLLIMLGGIIATYASFINGRMDGSASMKVFIYVGLAIGVFGLGKIVFKWWKEKGKNSEEKVAEKLAGLPEKAPRIVFCSKCGAKNYNTSHFCHMCGLKLK